MKKTVFHPFLLLAFLVLIVALACDININVPSAPSVPSDTPVPVEPAEVSTSTESPSPLPTFTFTIPPTSTQTYTPTYTATLGFSVIVPVVTILPVIPLLISTNTPVLHLDYTASPNYGAANLSAGFTPDPYHVGITAGGNVDVAYLGSACSGYASAAPDLRLNYSGGGASLVRIYYIGNQDSTLIVNDPYGNFYCVDDSFGTVHPTIDFNNPAGGSYDIWVGSYASGSFISGTLYITSGSGNHP
jgi:hypothetical protein